jgi:NAD(P)-dependent dehydrogenase (short-subunit alcohol dehydrogenase family)
MATKRTSTNGASAQQAAANGAVVVTGASTGIGRATALRLDRLGFQVYAGVRKDADGKALKSKAKGSLTPVRLDVTDDSSIAAAAETVAKALGAERGLAGLVNNAGIAMPGPIEFLPLEDLRKQLEVNVIGQVAVTQAFLPLLRKGFGRIVNIGSIGGRMATPFQGAYNASKFAMEALTDSLRMELKPWGLHVSIVEPGNIDTPIWEKGLSQADVLLEKLPHQARELYDPAVDAAKAAAQKSAQSGIPPSAVAKAVVHALTADKPKTRYVVGTDAHIQAVVARLVPDTMKDWLVAREMGLSQTH